MVGGTSDTFGKRRISVSATDFGAFKKIHSIATERNRFYYPTIA
jgi:hypothetical protein